ncbi:hypothetical protein BDZ85DRAFT_276467 [Elsinoe ampelina]|uniref:Beta-lactamase superfamily domain-containing protein n=1 Tax=Elsinoe ampelina TaxID=302913 RepID=A0A6A6G180_9PEZI|nr:hypothetical protein BDZ85DRAFT_276467 [Elsinoe ampelina]
MPVSVQHLNADTTFLITCISETSFSGHGVERPHKFTILVDPWLAGSSSIWMPRFQISHHTSDPHITSLQHLPLPDIILISQDKPDHCHEETLRTLPADTVVHIVAVPAAAKKIKSWRYFTNATISVINPYRVRNPETVLRIPLHPKDVHGVPGEVTLSYIPQSYDMTNLHNAVGITYSPPSSQPLDGYGKPITLPISPPMTPVLSRTDSDPQTREPIVASNIFPASVNPPVSILYTPHGIGLPCITPYINNFLAPLNALPLTLLFHAINVEQNPWFLGGLVATGLPGGMELVKRFGAKYWISAHDEAKDNRGWATLMIKSTQYTMEEAQILCDDEVESVIHVRPL